MTASFYNDNSRFVTGSSDNTVIIWSLTDFSKLETLTFSDDVVNVGLHPTDNRLFVLLFDGSISVRDPSDYTEITTITYPSQANSGAPNYIVFLTVNDEFIVGGYDGVSANPNYYIYDATSYALVNTVATTIPAGD